MRAKLVNLNNCAVTFLSRATVNLYWYDHIACIEILNCYHFKKMEVEANNTLKKIKKSLSFVDRRHTVSNMVIYLQPCVCY